MKSLYPECRFALKEWAVVEKALLEGKQALLIRKGGLIDGPPGFQAEHSSFYIYPTFHHQQRDGIKKEFEYLLKSVSLDSPPVDDLTLSLFAEVRKGVRVDRKEVLNSLDPGHIFNSAEIDRRFNFGKTKGLSVLFLKVYRLKEPVRIPVRPGYSGCRSWVDLGFSLKGGESSPLKAPLPDPIDFP